jgi:hypothetical protein
VNADLIASDKPDLIEDTTHGTSKDFLSAHGLMKVGFDDSSTYGILTIAGTKIYRTLFGCLRPTGLLLAD